MRVVDAATIEIGAGVIPIIILKILVNVFVKMNKSKWVFKWETLLAFWSWYSKERAIHDFLFLFICV